VYVAWRGAYGQWGALGVAPMGGGMVGQAAWGVSCGYGGGMLRQPFEVGEKAAVVGVGIGLRVPSAFIVEFGCRKATSPRLVARRILFLIDGA